MPPRRKAADSTAKLFSQWTLQPGATLGSSVRAKGILLEVRAQLPLAARKLIHLEPGVLALRLGEDAPCDPQAISMQAISMIVDKTLAHIEDLPVIPREVEDILAISATERHRWLKDGRLQSAGTRTVKLRGRAKKITFHVFDPVTSRTCLIATWSRFGARKMRLQLQRTGGEQPERQR
jgi:hypothetical protein